MAEPWPIPDAALENHLAILGKTGSGKSNCAAATLERLIRNRRRVCVVDPMDRYWGLRLDADGKKPSGLEPVIFGGAHGDLPLSVTHGAAVAEIVGTTTTPVILSTRMLTVGERTRFFTDFAETLLRKNEGPLHLVIDEAHLFMPQQGASASGGAPAMLHAGNNLVSLGRGIGLRIMLLSQRAAKLHNDALGQVATLIAFRLMLPHDREAVRRWINEWADPALAAKVMPSLPSLPTGTGWLWAPELDILKQATFPLVTTYDSGVPPKAGTHAPTLNPIDLAAVRGRLEVVAKEAVENDPRRLKARIAELEKQLAAKPAPADPVLLDQEWSDGYHQGRAEQAAEDAERIATLKREIRAAIGHLIAHIDEPDGGVPVVDVRHAPAPPILDATPVRRRLAAAPARPETRAAAAPPPAIAAAPLNGKLPPGEQSCLTAAIQFGAVNRDQLTLLTGYKRSTRNTYIARLQAKGLVTVAGAAITPTPNGIALLGEVAPLPTGGALLEHWRGRLPDGERRLLDVLVEHWPNGVPREEIDALTGFKRSTRNTYISRLRLRMLVEPAGEGVVASEMLFD